MPEQLNDCIAQALADVLVQYGQWDTVTIHDGVVTAEKEK